MTENSKKVRIQRAGSFLSRSQGREIDEYFQDAIQEVGSYFEGRGSKRIASGLTIQEEQILLPAVVGLAADDRDFYKKRDDYYRNMFTKVPHKGGIELEIGLTDPTKPLSKDNLPINLSDYIRYRHAIKHPWVARSAEAAKGNQLVRFYVFDEVSETANTETFNEDKDMAVAHYLSIKEDAKKVDMMLTLLGVDPRTITGQTEIHTKQARKQRLRTLVDAKPAEIVKLASDKNFDIKFKIAQMINVGVLKVVGTRHLIVETGDAIGNNYEEAVEFFKDEKNNETIQLLSAKAQEGVKKDRKTKQTS